MQSNMIGLILGSLLILALAALATLIGAYIYLLTRQPCPHCRVSMPRNAAICPHCGKGVPVTT